MWLAGGLALTALAGTVAVLRRCYIVVRVHGTSMTPTLRDGDRVLVRRVQLARVGPGDMVVIKMPPPHTHGAPPWLVKRAVAVPGDPVPTDRFPILPATDRAVPPDRLVLLGDNPTASYDSRLNGYFAADKVLGVVVRTL
ncbi:signal peptidase I [Virgisporangium aurantiacum]|nr:signal peptidase I [Virgisporangium aurantiacum]